MKKLILLLFFASAFSSIKSQKYEFFGCEGTFTDGSNELQNARTYFQNLWTDPNSEYYGNPPKVIYKIETPPDSYFTIDIDRIELDDETVLYVYKDNYYPENLIATYEGRTIEPNYLKPYTNVVYLVLDFKRIISNPVCCWEGFTIRYRVDEVSYDCDQSISSFDVHTNRDGNIGIGTTSPSEKLEIHDRNTEPVAIQFSNQYTGNGSGNGLLVGINQWGWGEIWNRENNFIRFGTNNLESMRIDNNGNVGIGTTAPTEKLEVDGWIGRTAHNNGGLVGSYNNVGANSYNSNPIYIIGSNYKPGTTSLSNMYGVGYSHTNASFISKPANGGWGLYVASDGDARVFLNASSNGDSYFNAGNVGIGTTSPKSKLEVFSTLTLGYYFDPRRASLHLANGSISMVADANELYTNGHFYLGAGYGQNFYFRNVNESSYEELMVIRSNGRVGIGTTSPDYKLDVTGTVRACEVMVNVKSGDCPPDYVFADDYKLRPLAEVEKFVNENKHLPEIAPAAEMETNGMALKEMNMLMLKKIEELTLYIIEQQKLIETQQVEIKSLRVEMEEIKK